MPKVNVYLPDDLAAAVRAAGIPVSPVCQQALAAAVRSVGEARRAISVIRSEGFDPASRPALGPRLESRMTARLAEVLGRARQVGGGLTGTAQLLLGLLDEGHGLGLSLLQAVDIDPDEIRGRLAQPGACDDGEPGAGQPGEGFTRQAWRVIASAAEASIDFSHNYLGTEHLVIGLLAEPDSAGGRVLRHLGGDPASARKALTSMLAGFAHARAQDTAAQPAAEALTEIVRRLDALETRVAALTGAGG